jgi:putative phage-type endonuclease
MRTVECEQGSAQWLAVRSGRITASRICDVMAVLKRGGESADRRNYRMALVAERLTGQSEQHYVSPEMLWGTEQEQFARTAYELQNEVMTDQVGFVLHPTLDYSGASPDSLVGDLGGLELKCPKTTTHLAYMMAGQVPEEYQHQMQWNMACADREWWDFASYDPRLPEGLRLFKARLPRDEGHIAEITEEVIRLNSEVEEILRRLGAPKWNSALPPTHAELNAKTVKVGDIDVPEDIMAMLAGEVIP